MRHHGFGKYIVALAAVKTAHAVYDNRVAIARMQSWPVDRHMMSLHQMNTATEEDMQLAVHKRIEQILQVRPNSRFWRNYCRNLYVKAHRFDAVILARGGTPVPPKLDTAAWGPYWSWWFQPIKPGNTL